MTIVWTVVTVLLLISAVLTSARILMGPTSLDRVVALDVLVALCMCGLAAWAAYSGDSTVIPAIVALSLLSFIGSISIARFRVRDDQS
ncbi:monovalent cation/H+ antiporter complex subunit F [Gordonia sp. (in: high G+C Gram-positive bacteria)]|jgi:multicomponent Na+:H+ antiporter subunit F|uniref:monovalent cation/H+ antiporter complex subunit F n=1 Tax=Gordonia sp. (in: high G+C Gram-positive bacteria) TaxID=84139 RepID=UPI001DD56DE1|nr:monovalent cation/H+ antiporter complex subunit F [Gordonia sp. (in: high G+C Gram-positive bacteria)]MCB1296596.1 cation:proton antiporter [Gordonia sp. (in: high G+C Gram-positive bacteria)]HMS74448.1 monovalent cation/H+ antiporter complex subunit F [Gordonia sp. (in: high G+C Gram-positive bacteria)]HQV17744.1 monovalent cation/H+ antiporter complex subunit F [Gordonia sp. (in: high G+C Gram-positive bacteria)]